MSSSTSVSNDDIRIVRTVAPSPTRGLRPRLTLARLGDSAPLKSQSTKPAALEAHGGWFALFAAIALTCVGIITISTVTDAHAAKQTIWFVAAIVVFVACLIPKPRQIGMASGIMMGFFLLLLVMLIMPGVPRSIVPVINGARSWIDLKVMNFQPSEVAKPIFVLSMAWYLRHRKSYRTPIGLLIPFGFMCVPVLLILKQPDLGTAILFGPTLFAMLIAAGAKLRHLGMLAGLGLLLLVVVVSMILLLPDDSSLHILKPHQRNRILAMVSQVQGDTRYINDIGYHGYKAMTLVGAGQFAGYGGEQSAQVVHFNRLPEDHNDMIFVVLVNRWGFVGGIALLAMYMLLIASILRVAKRHRDPFIQLSCVGFAALLFTQMAINVGMTMGLFPITGINLPFVSYGGSSLIAQFGVIGLVFNFASRRPAPMSRQEFQFDKSEDA